MNWKRYQNELILAAALLFFVGGFVYKQVQHKKTAQVNRETAQEIALFQETVSLKKVWGDKKNFKRLEKIKSLVSSDKVTWRKKGKKLTVKFTDMPPADINKIVTKILNIPVQLELMKIEKSGKRYTMEIKCKW